MNSKTTTDSSSLPSRGRSCQNEASVGPEEGGVLIGTSQSTAADTGHVVFGPCGTRQIRPNGWREAPDPGYSTTMHVPPPRGPLTEELFRALRSHADDFYAVLAAAPAATGEDAALALWALHE